MRESRTYGSVRGARDETHVPTATVKGGSNETSPPTRALAVTTAARSEILPDVPVLSDFVPGYEASAWLGLGAPRNTPADIVERLNRETNARLMSPEMKARFRDLGDTAFTSQPAEFGPHRLGGSRARSLLSAENRRHLTSN